MSIEWLAQLAWKSLVLAAIALAVIFLARRRSAAEKSLIGDSCLLSLLLLPLTTALLPRVELAAPPTVAAAVERLAPAGGHPAAAAAASAPIAGEAAAAFDWSSLAVALYALPALALVLGLAWSLLRLRALYDRARIIDDVRWLTALASAQNRVGVKHGTALLLSDEIDSPISWGVVRPVIMIDSDAGSAPSGAEAIIAHELAHVHRLDWLRLLVSRVALALFWFNPLVWALARHTHQLREEAADDAVLRSHVAKSDYAKLLVTAVRHSNARLVLAANGVAPSTSSIAQRVNHVLDASRSRRAAPFKWAAATLAIALAANAALAASEPVLERSGIDNAVRVATGGSPAPAFALAANSNGLADQRQPGAAADRTGAETLPEIERPVFGSTVLADALITAARSGDVATLAALIAHGGNPNAILTGDGTPLIAAARAGRPAAVRFLLARGANPNLGVPGDGNPLIAAARAGRGDVVSLLLDSGAQTDAAVPDDGNALIAASAAGHVEIVKLLLERGADADQIVPGDDNALIAASRAGRARVVDLLIARGADVNGMASGRTPLSVARLHGRADIQATLFGAGAMR